jgi:hypothetical protein
VGDVVYDYVKAPRGRGIMPAMSAGEKALHLVLVNYTIQLLQLKKALINDSEGVVHSS